jgi:hypothetical protein
MTFERSSGAESTAGWRFRLNWAARALLRPARQVAESPAPALAWKETGEHITGAELAVAGGYLAR